MIIVRYKGGLGNQMFQYAFAYALKRKFPDVEITADVTHYQLHNEHNGFELEKCFGIAIPKADKKTLKEYSPYYVPGKAYSFAPRPIKRYISRNLQFKYYNKQLNQLKDNVWYYKQEYHNTYAPDVFEHIGEALKEGKTVYLDGLWQDIRYFDEYKDDIKEIFSLSDEPSEENSIGIHIRCGDFLNSKFDICPPKYYAEALDIIKSNTTESNTTESNATESNTSADNPVKSDNADSDDEQVYVFTDDTIKAVDILGKRGETFKYINSGVQSSLKDMELLSRCSKMIISNSTFAFWAAYLGEPKLVIAPKYSVIKPEQKFELYTPDEWVVIDNGRD